MVHPATDVDPGKFITEKGAALNYGQLRGLVAKFQNVPGVIGLHGGLPPSDAFPMLSLDIKLRDGSTVTVGENDLVQGQLQYGIHPSGLPSLRDWATRHVADLHGAPRPTTTIIVGGASQGLSALFSMLFDPGDSMVVEELSYPQVSECLAAPDRINLVPIATNDGGMCPLALTKGLEGIRKSGTQPFPKLLYTVPTAQNPTGTNTGLERRKEIYEVCRAYDLLILEDDPYYYLQFPHGSGDVPGLRGLPRAASYLSLDVDGRVLRLDSASKFLAPGLRLAWLTCHPRLAEVAACAVQTQTLGACGVAQAMAAALLSSWGEAGLHDHLSHVQRIYAERAEAMHAAAQRHLEGLARWSLPRAGMFLWMTILGVDDASQLTAALVEAKVVVAPGRIFHARSGLPGTAVPCVRLAFSFETPENIEEAVARLAQALRLHRDQKS
ncbi:hypothetical protein ACKKBF_B03955 [Auxenochlorella protothecoides x Auxenochlorella symbiontica]